jgi:hypothetical protein
MSSLKDKNDLNFETSNDHSKINSPGDEEKGLLEGRLKPTTLQFIDPKPNQLECDAYLLASILIEGTIKSIFLFFVLILMILFVMPMIILISFCRKEMNQFKFFIGLYPFLFLQIILILSNFVIVFLLIAPAICTIITQFFLIDELEKETNLEDNMEKFFLIKILLIAFYFFLALKECAFATEAIGFLITNIINIFRRKMEFQDIVSRFITFLIYFISFSIQFCIFGMQIFLSFYLSRINLLIIYKEVDLLSLIQNYAALTCILELDNAIVLFLRYTGILNFFQLFLEIFGVRFNNIGNNEEKLEKDFEKWDFGGTLGQITNSIKTKNRDFLSAFVKYIIAFKKIVIILGEEKFGIDENLNKTLLSFFKLLFIIGGAFFVFSYRDVKLNILDSI